MIRTVLSGLVSRLRSWWTLEEAEDRIDGSGEVYLDPAYNGRYTAERKLQELSKASEEAGPAGETERVRDT